MYTRKAKKTTTDVSCKLALFTIEITKDLDYRAQQVVIEKLISHLLIKSMVLDYLNNVFIVRQNQEVTSSSKIGITYHLVGQKSFQIVVVKDIVCMLASSQSRACKIQGLQGLWVLIGIILGRPWKGIFNWT